jgi:hypothetical protein
MIDFLEGRGERRRGWWKTMSERLGAPVLTHPSFTSLGHRVTAPVSFSQSIEDYLRCQHSRATWAEDHLGEKASADFDAAMMAILRRYVRDDMLTFEVQTRIEWGLVQSQASA